MLIYFPNILRVIYSIYSFCMFFYFIIANREHFFWLNKINKISLLNILLEMLFPKDRHSKVSERKLKYTWCWDDCIVFLKWNFQMEPVFPFLKWNFLWTSCLWKLLCSAIDMHSENDNLNRRRKHLSFFYRKFKEAISRESVTIQRDILNREISFWSSVLR